MTNRRTSLVHLLLLLVGTCCLLALIPVLGDQPCDQGSNEWANIDQWKKSGGSWDIKDVLLGVGTCEADVDKEGEEPSCVAALLLIPKNVKGSAGDKVYMYRGCPGGDNFLVYFEIFLVRNLNRGRHMSDGGAGGRNLNNSVANCGIEVVGSEGDDKVKILGLVCYFKPEAAPKRTGGKIDGKCLTAFHKDAKNFRANPKSFPLDKRWACGDKVGAGVGTGTRSDMKTVFLIATLTCLVSYFWNHLPLLSD